MRIVKERSKESEAQGWKEAMRDCKTKKGRIDYHLMTVRIISFISGWIVPAHCMYCIASYWIGLATLKKMAATIERGILGKTKATRHRLGCGRIPLFYSVP